jgi:hypothetical protein
MIASEAAGVAALREQSEPWRSSADFLLSQRLPRAAAEFLRARLEDPSGLPAADVTLLTRAAIACDAAVYLAKSGLTTIACGQSRIACDMGIALRQPNGRAS